MPRLASILLAPILAACGTDTSGDADATTAGQTDAGQTDAPITTGPAPTHSTTTGDTPSSTSAPDPSASTTALPDPPTTSSSDTTDITGTSSTTGDDPPPPDPCADQDDPPPAVTREPINADPRFIQVYDNNIENLKIAGEQCPGDWTDLIDYMKTIEPSPDLFFVQQISDTAQLNVLVDRMTADLPGDFAGVIADADPWTQGSPCGKEKEKQTNAIVYRTGRFSKVGDKHVWQSWANKDGECVRSNQARTRNVMLKLHDKIADRDVTVASLHWSTSQGQGDDPACAEANIAEAHEKLHMAGFAADLVVFGGDFNESDRQDDGDPRPWFKQANGDGGGPFNYRDPIYRLCQSDPDLQTCLDDNWTIGSARRIDMLFAQDGDGCRVPTARAHTVTFGEGDAAGGDPDLNYSEHRAIRAEIYY